LSVLSIFAAVMCLFGCASIQRKLLYFPSHLDLANELTPWLHEGQIIGYAREVHAPKNIWLMLHGNGGQAAHRASTLPFFSREDSVYILEYPGYGLRSGTPSMKSINEAASTAYNLLCDKFPSTPVCIVGESLGSGPASFLAAGPRPPDKLILIVPYDELAKVAGEHYPFLPVRFILYDNWNNLTALANYKGPLEIYAEKYDTVIPIAHARFLAATKPQSVFHELTGGHNDWTLESTVKIQNP
jgi:pimeloyl-ACP methyl ester carboxylesterase